jgi:hypothetical protein
MLRSVRNLVRPTQPAIMESYQRLTVVSATRHAQEKADARPCSVPAGLQDTRASSRSQTSSQKQQNQAHPLSSLTYRPSRSQAQQSPGLLLSSSYLLCQSRLPSSCPRQCRAEHWRQCLLVEQSIQDRLPGPKLICHHLQVCHHSQLCHHSQVFHLPQGFRHYHPFHHSRRFLQCPRSPVYAEIASEMY